MIFPTFVNCGKRGEREKDRADGLRAFQREENPIGEFLGVTGPRNGAAAAALLYLLRSPAEKVHQ